MADHRRILELLFQGRSYRDVVAAVGCSHRDVAAARRVIVERGVTAERLSGMPEAELMVLFPDGRTGASREYDPPDFARVVAQVRRNPHFTLLQAWRTYVGVGSERRKYGYSQYCHLFNEYAVRHDIVATLHHEPGRAMFVDWAGDTIPIVDAVSGEIVKAYLFVAVLPFSGYMFVRAYENMRMDAWIDAHVSAYQFYGGVPQITVPDNALTATHRKQRGDAARFVHDRYRQLADHYGTAIVPTRVAKPRDKAAVESAVNTANKRVIGYLLEEVWTTLGDMNTVIAERVWEINHGIRRVDGTTRFERFRDEEAALLKRLPREAFEEVAWKELKARRNYHVTADYQHYSVPYALAGQLLRVRMASSQVSIFSGERIVAEHTRKHGRKGQYSTNPAHVPPQHKDVAGLWSRRWFLDRASAIGPATTQVIEQILDRYEIEAQSYLDCQNILGSLGKNKQKLEAACQQLLNMRGSATYSTLKRLIASTTSDHDIPRPVRAAASNSKNEEAHGAGPDGALVRGAEYYREGGTRMFTSVDYEKFRALRITHVATRFEELIKDEGNDELTPEQLFLTAVDDALDLRRANRIEKRIRQADFPIPHATIAELDCREGRNINPTRMRRYAAHDWTSDPTNLLIISPTGGGKTYLTCAIGIAACQREHEVLYARMDDLARKLVIAHGDGIAHQDLLTQLSNTDLLIIDDFLTIGIDPNAANDLFAILANREHRLPTIVASQSGPDYWAQALPDRVAADSIVNRLANNARKINLGDIDMRKEHNQHARNQPDHWE